MKELFKKALNNLIAIGIDVLIIIVNLMVIINEIFWWITYQSLRLIKAMIERANINRPDWEEFVKCVGKKHGKASLEIFYLRDGDEESNEEINEGPVEGTNEES